MNILISIIIFYELSYMNIQVPCYHEYQLSFTQM